MVRVFASGPGDLGSIPSRVIPKTQKMVLDASLLNTQHYKVRIKGKVEQSREGVAPSPTHWCSSYRKGSFRVTLDYGRQLYLLLRKCTNPFSSSWGLNSIPAMGPRRWLWREVTPKEIKAERLNYYDFFNWRWIHFFNNCSGKEWSFYIELECESDPPLTHKMLKNYLSKNKKQTKLLKIFFLVNLNKSRCKIILTFLHGLVSWIKVWCDLFSW